MCSFLSCISNFPCHWRVSWLSKQDRPLSIWMIDLQLTLPSRLQLESSAGNCSLPAQQTTHPDKNCLPLHSCERGWRKAQLQRAKTTTVFGRTKVYCKHQQHRLSLTFLNAKKWRRWVNPLWGHRSVLIDSDLVELQLYFLVVLVTGASPFFACMQLREKRCCWRFEKTFVL